MKIRLLNDELLDMNKLRLGDYQIGTVNAVFFLEETEKQEIIKRCHYLWQKLMSFWDEESKQNYQGLVRFDLVPYFAAFPKIIKKGCKTVIDLGKVSIKGIYEINDRAPECANGVSAVLKNREDLAIFQPSATKRLAKVIKKSFGEKVILVKGSGFLKEEWGNYFFEDLRKYLSLEIMTPEEFMTDVNNDAAIYLYGDFRTSGPSEFSDEFMDFIRENYSLKNNIFNFLPSNGSYISDKILLLSRQGETKWNKLVGKNYFLSEKNIDYALENQEKLVLKPFLGSSGVNVFIGKAMKKTDWKKTVRKFVDQGYGLFEARWLPKIQLPQGKFALDINPAFWAKGENLNYLYTISRIDRWERYESKRVINVAQGGGFIGALVD